MNLAPSFKLTLLSAALLTLSTQALALDKLETVKVVADAENEPGNLVISSEQITATQASSLENLLANESSVAVGGGSVAAQKIYVRGFEDVMLNVTVDNAQAPADLYHHQSRVQLEPEFIKTLELDAGAGAATNGAGALTGALKVTLKDAFDFLEGGQTAGALVKGTGIFNGDDGNKGSASAYGKLADNVGIVVGYTRESRDEYADGHGDIVEASPYDHSHTYLKLNGVGAEHEMSLTVEDLQDEATSFERPNLMNFNGNFKLSDQEVNRNTVSLNERYNPENDLVDVSATLFRTDADFRVQRQGAAVIYGEGDMVSTGFDLRNTLSIAQHKITFGTDFRNDDLESAQNATPPDFWGTSEQNAKVNGLYVQDNWEPIKSVNVSAGLRYDNYKFSVDKGVSDGVSIKDSGVSPNFSINWEIIDGLVVRSAYAQAFRGVTIREAFFSALFIHDGTLKSEKADNLEFGISYDWSNYFVRATSYKQKIDNFIDVVDGNDEIWGYWKNIGDAEVKGYELEGGAHFDNLTASLGVWNADNELNNKPLADNNLGLGTSIGRTWIAKLDYQVPAAKVTLGSHVRYVESEKNSIAATAPDKKSYTTVKAYANWQPTDDLTLALTVNNLFNKFYYDHATYTYIGWAAKYVGYPAVGREIVASVSYKF